jgi:nitrite reductase (NO-forming)
MRRYLKLMLAPAIMLILAACLPQSNVVNTKYVLTTTMKEGRFAFMGIGGSINGEENPTLRAAPGERITVVLIDGDEGTHDVVFPGLNVRTDPVSRLGETTSVTLTVPKRETTFDYQDASHAALGMKGTLVVGAAQEAIASAPEAASSASSAAMPEMDVSAAPAADPSASASAPPVDAAPEAPATGADIVRDPTDLPGPIGDRGPTAVRIDLESEELVGQLAEGTTFKYWTFNGKVPGPFFRVRVGDTVEVHLKNAANSIMPHSVDFHAVTGPGGGSVYSSAQPGTESTFTFKALHPGLFVYHCATPPVALHIANGMYGLILVEPEGGLPKVDHEFYVMQGEIYTTGNYGDTGAQAADLAKLANETPDYYVFNGAVGALTTEHPPQAKVGETVRFFFGVGGPNKISSFHIIGEIMDRVYDLASLTTPAMTDVQTTLVPPGGATVVELKLDVPGRYIFLDHAISRLQRGLAGYLMVDGPDAPDIFNEGPAP